MTKDTIERIFQAAGAVQDEHGWRFGFVGQASVYVKPSSIGWELFYRRGEEQRWVADTGSSEGQLQSMISMACELSNDPEADPWV